jgi:hypothetical protein
MVAFSELQVPHDVLVLAHRCANEIIAHLDNPGPKRMTIDELTKRVERHSPHNAQLSAALLALTYAALSVGSGYSALVNVRDLAVGARQYVADRALLSS